jgi:hypothetical protein
VRGREKRKEEKKERKLRGRVLLRGNKMLQGGERNIRCYQV